MPKECAADDDTHSKGAKGSSRGKEASCVHHFDALWFCYSPVHQFKQYYRVGNVDDCLSYWNDLYDCLRQRTKYRDADIEEETKAQHPLYKLRTPEEASDFWQAEFGHLDIPSASDTQP